METTEIKTKKEVSLIPIPNLEEMKVGHAGLYLQQEEEEENLIIEAQELKTIPLGVNGTKIMISIEGGVKEEIGKLAKDRENGLPNTTTGILVHYFVKGLEKDFNIVFDKAPTSIRERASTTGSKGYEKGRRKISKAEKNELIDKCGWDFWSKIVSSGEMSMEEAQREMLDSITKRTQYEEQGLYLSKNKTEGVKLFNWKEVVEKSVSVPKATKIYSLNQLEMVVPDVIENIYGETNQRYVSEGMKSLLKTTLYEPCSKSGVYYDLSNQPLSVAEGIQDTRIKTQKELLSFFDLGDSMKGWSINGIHIVKIKKSGMMKDRYVCFDVSNPAGERELRLLNKSSQMMVMR